MSTPVRPAREIAVLLGERLQSITLLHGLIREYASPEDYLVLARQVHDKLAGLTQDLGRMLGREARPSSGARRRLRAGGTGAAFAGLLVAALK